MLFSLFQVNSGRGQLSLHGEEGPPFADRQRAGDQRRGARVLAELIEQGTWVEIRRVVLAAGERAPQVPEDTARLPLEMRVRGFLLNPATIGDEAEVRTSSGRSLRGVLCEANPAYTHGFGPPIAELSGIRAELRAVLREQENSS